MDQIVQCDCGHLRGVLSHTEQCTRIKCYCNDCQAFAAFLGKQDRILDAQGGTDVVVAHPQLLRFEAGLDALQSMSLSDKGMLRWYAGCCGSAIGNTARDRKTAFVGLAHSFVARSPAAMEGAFGPIKMVSNTGTARGKVASSGVGMVLPLLGFARKLLGARLSGSYRHTPFFDAQGRPVAAPTVLTPAERAALGPA